MGDERGDQQPDAGDPTGDVPGGGVVTVDSAPGSAPSEPVPGRWSPPTKHLSRGRRILVDALIGLATLLLIVGIFSVWANRLLFNPNNWATASGQLLQSPTIRSTAANYVVDQLYANVNVPGLIKSALPPRLGRLADPAAGALRNVAVQGVDSALSRPRVQELWTDANRAADKTFIAVVKGGKGPVGVKKGVVTLDLAALVDEVAARLGLPPNLGAKLPPKVANLTVLKSNQLAFVQKAGNALRDLALGLTILVPVLYALAIALAPGRRRRTLVAVGFAAIFGGLAVIVGRSIFDGQVVDSLVRQASVRPAVSATVEISTRMMGQIAAACIYVGIALVIAAWFAGPGRLAYAARRAIAPFLRDRPAAAYATTLGLMALVFIWDPIHATGTPAGIITFTLLALFGMFVLRRQTMQEFPDARPGDATHSVQAWIDRQRHRGDGAPAAPPSTLTAELRELSDLREHGALTPHEYDAAKAKLLHG